MELVILSALIHLRTSSFWKSSRSGSQWPGRGSLDGRRRREGGRDGGRREAGRRMGRKEGVRERGKGQGGERQDERGP